MSPPSEIIWPLGFLLAVVLVTAKIRGTGLGSLGGSSGGGRFYVYIIFSIFGFVAMTTHSIPRKFSTLFFAAFTLGKMTALIGLLVPLLGSSGALLFNIFPVDMGTYSSQIMEGSKTDFVGRYTALSSGFNCLGYYVVARSGIRNLLQGPNFLKLLLVMACFTIGLMGGYRTFLISLLITLAAIFTLEGLFRNRYAIIPVLALVLILLGLPFTRQMPLPIQRSLSFLPIDVDPLARHVAEETSEWRIELWKLLLPEVPQYLLLGKGLSFSVSELNQLNDLSEHGGGDRYSSFIITGNYHNGPLSVIIPFGIWGGIGWIWFVIAAGRVLYHNHLYGDNQLKTINTAMFAAYFSNIMIFFFIYGSLSMDICNFTGLVGLSISLNGGIKKRSTPQISHGIEPGLKFARFRNRVTATQQN